jgi:hypothetical protein
MTANDVAALAVAVALILIGPRLDPGRRGNVQLVVWLACIAALFIDWNRL